jgi:hypothetical protein
MGGLVVQEPCFVLHQLQELESRVLDDVHFGRRLNVSRKQDQVAAKEGQRSLNLEIELQRVND